MIGTIKKLMSEKGYGFVRTQEGEEYFFHRSNAEGFDKLNEGQRVAFEVEPSPKGLRAVMVTRG